MFSRRCRGLRAPTGAGNGTGHSTVLRNQENRGRHPRKSNIALWCLWKQLFEPVHTFKYGEELGVAPVIEQAALPEEKEKEGNRARRMERVKVYCTLMYCVVQYCIIKLYYLYCITQYSIAVKCNVMYCITLYCTAAGTVLGGSVDIRYSVAEKGL